MCSQSSPTERANGNAFIDEEGASDSRTSPRHGPFVSSGRNATPLSDPRNHRSVSQDHGRSGTSSPSVAHSQTGGSQETTPNATRDTFLNYFFGGQGTSPYPAGGSSNMFGPRHETSGREPYPEMGGSLASSLGNRGLENSPAYDMKSLGKHIEANAPDPNVPVSAREEMEIMLIRSLIASYFSIVRQSIQDLVPKAIMHFLVNHTSQQVQNRLVATLYKPELFADLLDEDEALVNERTRVKALLEAYKEAFKTLSEVTLRPTS